MAGPVAATTGPSVRQVSAGVPSARRQSNFQPTLSKS
jgi:hypothetical protein